MNLAEKHCIPCRGGVPPLAGEALEKLQARFPDGRWWTGIIYGRLTPSPIFGPPWTLSIKAGAIAEAEGHHPDLLLSWGKVEVKIWTHKIDGLTESDFILAAKIDQIQLK